MGKMETKKAEQGFAVVNRLSGEERLQKDAYEKVNGASPVGLLPVLYDEEKNALTAAADGMVLLREHLSGIIGEERFIEAVSQLLSIIKNCENAQLDVRNLSLSLDSIFVEVKTGEIKCIFWPVENSESARDPVEFFRELPYFLVFDKKDDCSRVVRYIAYFRKAAGEASLEAFAKVFEETKSGTAITGDMPMGVPVEMDGMHQQDAGLMPEDVQRNICPNCGVINAVGAKICVSCNAALMEEADILVGYGGGTGVLGYAPGEDDRDTEESPYPYLIRERTNQIISVDMPVFRIGKEKSAVDFYVSDNSAISRTHAVIYTREDRYFIVDEGSTNKTAIDGRMIAPHKEVEIFPGARIKMANEEFLFYV
ncbi:FHA domain-containing protein [Eubacteriales bacterium OttesenSCG-928-M02]|nr:FHA domain-containing protein [Eubacteriales bacterium OttesenSCG-928-M02]